MHAGVLNGPCANALHIKYIYVRGACLVPRRCESDQKLNTADRLTPCHSCEFQSTEPVGKKQRNSGVLIDAQGHIANEQTLIRSHKVQAINEVQSQSGLTSKSEENVESL